MNDLALSVLWVNPVQAHTSLTAACAKSTCFGTPGLSMRQRRSER
jgi:hypothetical protein